MPEKQLNFLNIFEPSKHEIEDVDSGLNKDVVIREDSVVEEDAVAVVSAEPELEVKSKDLISDSLIKREEEIKKEAALKLKRLHLLKTREDALNISDFEDLMPEIKAYEIRILVLKAAYNIAAPGKDKETAYLKLVSPDIYDEEAHRDSARLYLKYLEVAKQEETRQSLQLRTQKKIQKAKPINTKTKPETWRRGSGRDRAVEKFE